MKPIGDCKMKSIVSLFRAYHADDSGAAFIEYTALLGVILAVGIILLSLVGNWANVRWSKLNSQITANP